jgi:hypothetical protein
MILSEKNLKSLQDLNLVLDISHESKRSITNKLEQRLSYPELYLLHDRISTLETIMANQQYRRQAASNFYVFDEDKIEITQDAETFGKAHTFGLKVEHKTSSSPDGTPVEFKNS